MPNESVTSTQIGTSSYTSTGTYVIRNVHKYGKLVFINFTASYTADIPGGKNLGNVPEGYRPGGPTYLSALLKNNTGVVMYNQICINADGSIVQGATGYCREVCVSSAYFIW